MIYPRYAVVEVPTGTNNRYQDFYWNGEDLELQDIKGTTDDAQVDLGLVDPADDRHARHRARPNRPPESWYAIIADSPGIDPRSAAYASNDFGENTYIQETLDGTVIYDSEARRA